MMRRIQIVPPIAQFDTLVKCRGDPFSLRPGKISRADPLRRAIEGESGRLLKSLCGSQCGAINRPGI
jgi:hypothetical protein